MRKLISLLFTLSLLVPTSLDAQDSKLDKMRRKSQVRVAVMDMRSEKKYEKVRQKANEEYASMIESAWEDLEALGARPMPKDEELAPPVVTPEEDKGRVIEDRAIPIEEVIPPVVPKLQPEPIAPIEEEPTPEPPKEEAPVPQPVPISPIEEKPEPVVPEDGAQFAFTFFNTEMAVRLGEEERFKLDGLSPKEVAGVWRTLSGGEYDGLISDCLSLRKEYMLCDWAYLLMLRDMARAYYGGVCNEATLLTAFLYCQSGYTMRLAKSKGSLVLLYASEHEIYNKSYWVKDGMHFYALDCESSSINVCPASFPKESPMSLLIPYEPDLSAKGESSRLLKSRDNSIFAQVHVNESLVEFYKTYPTSMLNGDFGTRWAMYANTPLSGDVIESLYPTLRSAIEGLSVVEAADRLLNFVQTSFVYEYDEKVWGYDRAFFAEESLYYPYIDCEDRSILFTRLIRDLLGLEAVLVYYPGHLACAVHFPIDVPGDYISLGGKRYTVCDPTILGVGAPVGVTMSGMDNTRAKVILLD